MLSTTVHEFRNDLSNFEKGEKMSPLLAKTCPKCQHQNKADANFCAYCSTPLSGGKGKKCGVCGTENHADAAFCRNCGRNLQTSESPEMHRNRWSRQEGDFAASLEIDDLPGLLTKKLEVETGTRALIYSAGRPLEVLSPGLYTLENVGKSVSNWLQGVPPSASVLLVDVMPTEILIRTARRFTADPLPIQMSIRMVVEVENVQQFLMAALRNRKRYSLDDLYQYLEPEVSAATDEYLRRHTFEQLLQNSRTREELELAIESALHPTFSRNGLRLVSLRTTELDLEAYDKVRDIKANHSLLIDEGKAKLEGEERILALNKQVDLHELAGQTAKVEKEERRIELNQRIRAYVISDQMNEIRSKTDYEKFLEDIDRQKLLTQKEREDLIRSWAEEAEDHERARASLLAKLEVEQKFLLKAIEIKSNGELSLQEQDFQLQLERQRSDRYLEIEQMKWQAEFTKRQAQAEWDHQVWLRRNEEEQTERRQDLDEMKGLVDLKLYKSRQEFDLEQEKEARALERKLEEARSNIDIEIVKMDANHRREMERLEKLASLGTEALIAASPVEQSNILKDLKKMEIFKTMSEEQILALAAEKSPEIGKVFEEKYRAIAEGKADQRESEMYEKLLSESKTSQNLMLDIQRDAMDRIQQMAEKNLDAMKDVSESYAKHGSDPIIITGTAGNSMFRGSHPGINDFQEEMKICPGCGRQVTVSSRFCQYCKNEFKDVP